MLRDTLLVEVGEASGGAEVLGGKRQPLEKMLFQGEAFTEICLDQLLANGVVFAVTVKNIFQSLVQRHHHMMPHSFIGVVDDLPGPEMSRRIPFRFVMVEQDVLFDNIGDLGKSVLPADLGTDLGMVAVAVEAGCLGDIMEQRPGNHQVTVGLGPVRIGGAEPGQQLLSQAGDHQ